MAEHDWGDDLQAQLVSVSIRGEPGRLVRLPTFDSPYLRQRLDESVRRLEAEKSCSPSFTAAVIHRRNTYIAP